MERLMMLYWLALFTYILMLSIVIYFDSRYFIIPDWLTLPAIGLALLYCVAGHAGTWDIVLRISLTGGLFFITGLLTSILLKKETLGGGDIKLITVVGLYKGWQEGLLIVFFSAVSALVSVLVLSALRKRKVDERIPFGVYIAICGILMETLSFFWER